MTKKEKNELKRIYEKSVSNCCVYGRLFYKTHKQEYKNKFERATNEKIILEIFMASININAYSILTHEERDAIDDDAYQLAEKK